MISTYGRSAPVNRGFGMLGDLLFMVDAGRCAGHLRARPSSAPVNRGFGMLGDLLFMVTLDAHLLALDRTTGTVQWEVELADYHVGYAATMAPLVVEDKVIVGISGGEYATKGFIDAYDPKTGERRWRFYTIPGPDEPGGDTWPFTGVRERGGGGTWMTGSYDPETGENLWHYPTGSSIWGAAAMTHMLDGRQHVLIPSGTTLTSFALPEFEPGRA